MAAMPSPAQSSSDCLKLFCLVRLFLQFPLRAFHGLFLFTCLWLQTKNAIAQVMARYRALGVNDLAVC